MCFSSQQQFKARLSALRAVSLNAKPSRSKTLVFSSPPIYRTNMRLISFLFSTFRASSLWHRESFDVTNEEEGNRVSFEASLVWKGEGRSSSARRLQTFTDATFDSQSLWLNERNADANYTERKASASTANVTLRLLSFLDKLRSRWLQQQVLLLALLSLALELCAKRK